MKKVLTQALRFLIAHTSDLVGLGAIALLVRGAARIYAPAGDLMAGALLILVALLLAKREGTRRPR